MKQIAEQKAQEYKIETASITSERLGETYDVKSYVMELSLFEDIELPYLTGQMVLMDDMGVFDEMSLKGTETIRLRVSGVEENYNPSFELTMNITSIVKKLKVAERTEVYHLSLISPHAYRDAAVKVSKSFVGILDDIAANILQNYLDVDVSFDYRGGTVGQAAVKVIPPYLSPLESAKWLLERATTIKGIPFCCWQSVYEQSDKETIRIGNLDYMMTGGPVWNEDVPLIYSQSGGQSVALKDTLSQAFVLKDFVASNYATNLDRMCDGAIGSQFTTLDTYTSQNYSRHFGVNDYLETVKGEIMRGGEQEVHDPDMTLSIRGENKKLDEHDHRYINTVTSYGTYGSWNSYHDDPRQLDAMNKVRAHALRSLLRKNTYEIVAAGSAFFSPMAGGGDVGIGAGDVTKIDVFSSDTSIEEPEFDENRSGYYMIGKCRHIFKDTTHTVAAEITKLDKGQS